MASSEPKRNLPLWEPLEAQAATPLAKPSRNRPVMIRPFEAADALPMYAAVRETKEQLRRWMTWCNAGYSIADAKAFIARCLRETKEDADRNFAIIDKHYGDFLGSIGLNQVNVLQKSANVGYWVRKSAANQGAATQAARLVAQQAFNGLGFQRLEFVVPIENASSRLVAQRIGARFEKVLEKGLMIADKMHDTSLYCLRAADLAD